jgi:hypothetical protein
MMSNSTVAAVPLPTVADGNTSLLIVRLSATMPADDRERFFRRYGELLPNLGDGRGQAAA